MADENVLMERGDERKELPYDSIEVARHMIAGWRQVQPNPLQTAPPPHEGEDLTPNAAAETPHEDHN